MNTVQCTLYKYTTVIKSRRFCTHDKSTVHCHCHAMDGTLLVRAIVKVSLLFCIIHLRIIYEFSVMHVNVTYEYNDVISVRSNVQYC